MTIVLSEYFSFSASHLDLVRFHTIKGEDSVPATPSDKSRAAIPSPMIPSPINPTDDDIFNVIVVIDFDFDFDDVTATAFVRWDEIELLGRSFEQQIGRENPD